MIFSVIKPRSANYRLTLVEVDTSKRRISLSRREALIEENPEEAERIMAEEREQRERERAERNAERNEKRQQEEQTRREQAAAREERRRERDERRAERRRREEPDYELPPVESATTSLASLLGKFVASNDNE